MSLFLSAPCDPAGSTAPGGGQAGVSGEASQGDLAAVVCAQEVLAVSLPHESAEVLGWVQAWLVEVVGGREDGSAWGGWKCHVFPTQIHSRLKAEARAPQYFIVPSAGWSQTPPAEAQLSVVWEGPDVRLSSSHSWAQGHWPKQDLHWPSPCPAGMAQGALFPRGATRDVASPVHHCCGVPGLEVPVPGQEKKPEARMSCTGFRQMCPVQEH